MTLFRIALRSVFRNRRRSLMTLSTIAVGAASIQLIGAMLTFVTLDFQSSVIRRVGHLTVYKRGYFDFGAGNAAAFGIPAYQHVLDLIRNDPQLQHMTKVVTPVQALLGLAGNYAADRSKPFFGEGIVPEDRVTMRQWDDFQLGTGGGDAPELPAAADSAVVGYGLGRILGLCQPLHIPQCKAEPARPVPADAVVDDQVRDLAALSLQDAAYRQADSTHLHEPRLDLLAATAGGAPNVVGVYVDHAESEGNKNVDDNYAVVHLALAQQLVYGRGEHGVTGLVLQLYHSRERAAARSRLSQLFASQQLDLEVRDFAELTPLYAQVLAFFGFLFAFIAIILGVIVLFTVVNTMTMAVMERVDEIGTVRALGLQSGQVRRQFLLEGALLGILGATVGGLIAGTVAGIVNISHLTWSPPTSAGHVPLKLYLSPELLLGTWLVLVVVAAIAALFPANRAARMSIVDALRHV
jgi:putative ABC transport system permease protein